MDTKTFDHLQAFIHSACPSGVIVKAQDYAKYRQAQDIIAVAKITAEIITEDAETARQNAIDEGYQQGLAAARVEADRLIQAARDEAEQLLVSARHGLVGVISNIVEKVVHTTPPQDILQGLVCGGVEKLREANRVRIYLPHNHGVDEGKLASSLKETFEMLEKIEIEEEVQLSSRECVIETDSTITQCSAKERIEKINSLLIHSLGV